MTAGTEKISTDACFLFLWLVLRVTDLPAITIAKVDSAEATVDADAERAPADVLGPVIRETTTNVLRHGGGSWARLSLTREGAVWRYQISNDAPDDAEANAEGSGLDGLARRAGDAGGELAVHRDKGAFSVSISVPTESSVAG